MTLEEIYTALDKAENGAAISSAIKAEIARLNKEAASNRVAKNDVLKILQDLGINNDEAGKAQAEQLKALLDRLAADHKTPGDVTTQLTDMAKQLKDLTDKYSAAEKKAQEAEAKRIETAKGAELIKALTDAKCVSPTEIAKVLAAKVMAKDDGTLAYLGDDGKTELSIKDGVDNYLKSNTWAVSNTANPGAESHGPGGGANEALSKQLDEIIKNA